MESDALNNSPKTTLFIIEIVVGTCTLCIYIICWKPILQIRSVCMKDNCAYRVRLLENFHSRMINQARDVGGLWMSSTLPRFWLCITFDVGWSYRKDGGALQAGWSPGSPGAIRSGQGVLHWHKWKIANEEMGIWMSVLIMDGRPTMIQSNRYAWDPEFNVGITHFRS